MPITIANRGTGYETCHENNGAASYVRRAATQSDDRAQSFVLTFALQLNILTGTFLLVSCSNTFQTLLWSLHGQGQKG